MRRFDLLVKDAIDMLDEIRIKSANQNITERHLYNVQSILFMSLDSYEETQKEMNQPNQPAMKSYIKQFVKRWMDGHEPDTFVKDTQGNVFYTAGHSTLNLIAFFEDLLEEYITDCEVTLQQPPKSAEEVLEVIECYSPQFARYVTDDEIDAMWPITQGYEDENQAAKAMRDKIFNNVKPNV